jgi:hypothetical protein
MLIRCVDLAEKYNVRLIYLGAVRLLAKVLNEFEQFQEAFRILSSVMPYVRSLSMNADSIPDHRDEGLLR